jgi:hypothetical protein
VRAYEITHRERMRVICYDITVCRMARVEKPRERRHFRRWQFFQYRPYALGDHSAVVNAIRLLSTRLHHSRKGREKLIARFLC